MTAALNGSTNAASKKAIFQRLGSTGDVALISSRRQSHHQPAPQTIIPAHRCKRRRPAPPTTSDRVNHISS